MYGGEEHRRLLHLGRGSLHQQSLSKTAVASPVRLSRAADCAAGYNQRLLLERLPSAASPSVTAIDVYVGMDESSRTCRCLRWSYSLRAITAVCPQSAKALS